MRGKFTRLAYERPLYGPHEESLADLTLRRYVDHGQYERMAFVLYWIVHLESQHKSFSNMN